MIESSRIPFHIEMTRIIDLLAKQIYQSPLALLRENCQNAYDAILQRQHLGQHFDPQITVSISATEVVVTDNGIGMTRDDLINHYWRAGSSGKNTPEARAAGVVGTFGIGAMANFGIADALEVATESAVTGERTTCRAIRETLSATDDCIEMVSEETSGSPGTRVIARISDDSPVNVQAAIDYLREIVGYLRIAVLINEQMVSQQEFDSLFSRSAEETDFSRLGEQIGPNLIANVDLWINRSGGEVSLKLEQLSYFGRPIEGTVLLRQGTHQVRAFRSRFALATAGLSSAYGFGGIADLRVLEPTAGREALTTDSLQTLQGIITECENYVSERLAQMPSSDSNTAFMQWVINNGRYDLCSNLKIRVEPGERTMTLIEIRDRSKIAPVNYFEGTDSALITQYATEEQPLVVVSTRQPRRKCEVNYLSNFCEMVRISDEPNVLSTKSERDWSMAESAFGLRLVSIIELDYFVNVKVDFGKISHGLPILVDIGKKPIEIVLDSESASVALILKLYDEDFTALSAMVKDFVRNAIFPKIEKLVPSSTREGAQAFLKAMRRPREIFEYEKADLGNLSGIWEDYIEGRITLSQAAQQSTTIVRNSIQVVDGAATSSVTRILPDVIENQRILDQVDPGSDDGTDEALPAITRLEIETSAKLLTISEDEQDLKGYRCFIAITDRVRQDRSDFFLQPHRTEIIWGGQKALYIFQHHSGEFGLYYELQSSELFSQMPGGSVFRTCTIVLKNQIYIPIPDDISAKFIPTGSSRKRFEIRCELLFPDTQ